MNTRLFSAALVLMLALASAGTAHIWRPTRHLADEIGKPDLERLFPKQFGPWIEDTRMPVVLPSPDVQAKLDAIYNQVLSRAYIGPDGARIMLSVAYGGDQSDGTRMHRPEVCYPAQGFGIRSNIKGQVALQGEQQLPVRRLEAALGPRQEPITYWAVVGDQVVTSAREQKIAQLRYGVRGLIPDGVLIRVSSIDPETNRAFAHQDRFVRDLMHHSNPTQRWRMFGRIGASGAGA